MSGTTRWIVLVCLAVAGRAATAQSPAPRELRLDDLYRLREVSSPEVSPEGGWVAYTVATADTLMDRTDRDVWMTSWDGKRSMRLTTSKSNEGTPRWSSDGRYLAFLSNR